MRAILAAAGSATLLTLALAVPAQAATAGWHVVFTHHYGTSTDFSAFTATVAVGTNDAWAFGITGPPGAPPTGTPLAVSWNGSTWSSSPLPSGLNSAVSAASAVSASSIWAAMEVGGDILHWNGSQWSVAEQIPGATNLLTTGITAISDSDVWVFGTTGFGPGTGTWHFDGHTWTHVTGKVPGGISVASAVSAGDIWAVASNARGPAGDKLAHYNGTSWQFVTAKAVAGLDFDNILALSSTDVLAMSSISLSGHQKERLLHFNGSTWTSIPSAYPKLTLGSAAPDGQGGVWFSTLTGGDWQVHYSAGGQWSRVANTSGFIDALALIPGTTSLWGVGSVTTATASDARIWSYSPAS